MIESPAQVLLSGAFLYVYGITMSATLCTQEGGTPEVERIGVM